MPREYRRGKDLEAMSRDPEGVLARSTFIDPNTGKGATYDPKESGQKVSRRWSAAEESIRRLQEERGLPTEVPPEYPLEFLQTITEMSHPDIYAKLPEAISREVRRRVSRQPASVRFCKGVSKAGERCGGLATRGYELCNWHRGLLLTIQEGRNLANIRGNRRSTTDVLREVVEESFQEDMVAVPLNALSATKTGRTEEGELFETDVPDHDIRLRAFREIADRIDGKANQSIHVSGTGNPLNLDELYLDPTASEVYDVDYEELPPKELESGTNEGT